MSRKHLGAHLVPGSLHPRLASLLVEHSSKKVWLSLLLATCQEVLLGLHAVKKSSSCTQFTLCHIDTKTLKKKKKTSKRPSLQNPQEIEIRTSGGICWTQAWLALGRTAGDIGGLWEVLLPKHHTMDYLLKTRSFAFGKKKPSYPKATSSRKQFLLLLRDEQGSLNYLRLWSHTMCASVLELRFAGRKLRGLGACLWQGSWMCHWPHRNREEMLLRAGHSA